MQEHLFAKCEKLKDLYIKCNILEYEKVFYNNITIERLKQITKFVEELNLKQQLCIYIYIYIYIHAHIYVCMKIMCMCVYVYV